MKKIGIPALGLFVLWLLMSGHYSGLIMSFGLASSIGVALLAHRLGAFESDGRSFAFMARLLLYLPWLTREIVNSNLEVARVVWHPKLPVRRQVVRATATQRTDIGLATFANSVTLTPGTLSLDAEEPGILVAHALTENTASGLQSGEMNRRVTALEGNGVPEAEECA